MKLTEKEFNWIVEYMHNRYGIELGHKRALIEERLENYLLTYNGSVIIVAHDRYFLDKIVSKVIEIERGKTTVFSGNYTAYAEKKKILQKIFLLSPESPDRLLRG